MINPPNICVTIRIIMPNKIPYNTPFFKELVVTIYISPKREQRSNILSEMREQAFGDTSLIVKKENMDGDTPAPTPLWKLNASAKRW